MLASQTRGFQDTIQCIAAARESMVLSRHCNEVRVPVMELGSRFIETCRPLICALSACETSSNASNEAFADALDDLDRLSGLYASHLSETRIQPWPKLSYPQSD